VVGLTSFVFTTPESWSAAALGCGVGSSHSRFVKR
jgi:hypothetical protein